MSSSSVFVSDIRYSWKFHGGAWNTLCWCVWFRLAIRRRSASRGNKQHADTNYNPMVDGAGANLMARRPFHALIFLFWHRSTRGITMQPLGNKVEAFYKLRSDGDAAANPHARLASIFTLFGFRSLLVGASLRLPMSICPRSIEPLAKDPATLFFSSCLPFWG